MIKIIVHLNYNNFCNLENMDNKYKTNQINFNNKIIYKKSNYDLIFQLLIYIYIIYLFT